MENCEAMAASTRQFANSLCPGVVHFPSEAVPHLRGGGGGGEDAEKDYVSHRGAWVRNAKWVSKIMNI